MEKAGLMAFRSGSKTLLRLVFDRDRPYVEVGLRHNRPVDEAMKTLAPETSSSEHQHMSLRFYYESIHDRNSVRITKVTDSSKLPEELCKTLAVHDFFTKGTLHCVSIRFLPREAVEVGVHNKRHFKAEQAHLIANDFAKIKTTGSIHCFVHLTRPDFEEELACMRLGLERQWKRKPFEEYYSKQGHLV